MLNCYQLNFYEVLFYYITVNTKIHSFSNMYLSNDNILILLLFIAFLVLFTTMNIIHKQSISNCKDTIEPFELDCDFKHKDSPCCIYRRMKKTNGKPERLESDFMRLPYLVIDPMNGPYHYREHKPTLDSNQKWLLEMERSCNLNTITRSENPLLQYDVTSHYHTMKKWKEDMIRQLNVVKNEYQTASSRFDKLHSNYIDLVQEYKNNLKEIERLQMHIQNRKHIIQTIEEIDMQIEYRIQLQSLENEVNNLMTKEAEFKNRVQGIVQNTIDYIRDLPNLYFEVAKLYEYYTKSAPFVNDENYPETPEERVNLVKIRTDSKTKYDNVKTLIATSETGIKKIINTLTNYMFCNKLISTTNNNLQTNRDIKMEFAMPNGNKKSITFNKDAYRFNHVSFDSTYHEDLGIVQLFQNNDTGIISSGTISETITVHRLPSNDVSSYLEYILRQAIALNIPKESVATAISHKFLNETFKNIDTESIDNTNTLWEQKCGYKRTQ